MDLFKLKKPTAKSFAGQSYFFGRKALPINLKDEFYNQTVARINRGRFNGVTVVVDDSLDMKNLYLNGFFGKGCLSKKWPRFDDFKDTVPQILRKRQFDRRIEWKIGPNETETVLKVEEDTVVTHKTPLTLDPQSSKTKKRRKTIKNKPKRSIGELNMGSQNITLAGEVIVIDDSDVDDEDNEIPYLDRLNPRIEMDRNTTVVDSLYLMPEEAFFLMWGLYVLEVTDEMGQRMTILKAWKKFNENPDFLVRYCAYHYYRAKGWVVKSGLKFGADFVLYEKGPPFNHSSYIVCIQACNLKNRPTKRMEWPNFYALARVAESCNKLVVVCDIQFPSQYDEGDLQNPNFIRRAVIKDIVWERWVPEEERESEDVT